jgi:plasmid stability protein
MATLNIKDLPDQIHRKLRERALAHHRSVAQEVTHMLAEALDGAEERRSWD